MGNINFFFANTEYESLLHKSKYMICEAVMDPQKLNTAAPMMTAVVVPVDAMMDPIDSDKMN